MRIIIPQKILVKAIECGGSIALSRESQSDSSNMSFYMKSVKIVATNDDITFYSNSPIASVKHAITVKDNEIEVKETGEIVVPAKEFYMWVSKQTNSIISIALSKLATPEAVNLGDDDDVDSSKKIYIKRIGTVKFVSKDNSKTGNKWALDCYDPSQFISSDFSQKPNLMFVVPSDQMVSGVKNTVFSALKKDFAHVFDSLLFESYKGVLHMAGCDSVRCSVYKIESSDIKDGNILNGTRRILIPVVSMEIVSKFFKSGENISVYYDDTKNKAFICFGNTEFKILTAEKDHAKKFPSIALLLNGKYDEFCTIDKEILLNRLSNVSIVNKSAGLFIFNKPDGQEGALKIKAISEMGLQPSESLVPVKKLNGNNKAVWSISHIVDIVKAIKDDDVCFLLPPNNFSLKITSKADSSLSYFTMAIKKSKYNLNDN